MAKPGFFHELAQRVKTIEVAGEKIDLRLPDREFNAKFVTFMQEIDKGDLSPDAQAAEMRKAVGMCLNQVVPSEHRQADPTGWDDVIRSAAAGNDDLSELCVTACDMCGHRYMAMIVVKNDTSEFDRLVGLADSMRDKGNVKDNVKAEAEKLGKSPS